MSTESTEVAHVAQRRVGVVLSNKMDKTVVVETQRSYRHSRYEKFMRERSRVKAHDEKNTCEVGDTVLIEQTRPLSKDKRWRVVEVVERAQQG